MAAITAIVGVVSWQLGNRVEALRTQRDAPRHFTDAQRAQFLAAVGVGPKTGPISVSGPAMNSEAYAFAHEILTLLRHAGWICNDVAPQLFANEPLDLILVVADPNNSTSQEDLIQREFGWLGFKVSGQVDRSKTPRC